MLNLIAVAGQGFDCLTCFQGAAFHTTRQHAPDEGVGAQCSCQHAEWLARIGLLLGRFYVINDQVKQGIKVLARAVEFGIAPAIAARGIKMRKIELLFVSVKACEEVKAIVECAVGITVRLVHLVEHDNRAQAEGERFGGHKLRLRHRSFGGIDQQNNAVNHRKNALNLTAKVGVAGGVHNVDPGAFPLHRCGFGEDRDTTLTLDVVAVHRALGRGLIVAVGAGLLEKFVHQSGLAVVNVCDDRDVANVHEDVLCGSCARLILRRPQTP